MARHFRVLRFRVCSNEEVNFKDNTALPTEDLDLLFQTQDKEQDLLAVVSYRTVMSQLLDQGWDFVCERPEYPETTFIASFKLCLIVEHHHATLGEIAKEAAKLVLEIAKEEAIELGIRI